jgi:hypothetical protein
LNICWSSGEFLHRVEVKSSDVSEEGANSILRDIKSVSVRQPEGYLVTLTKEADCSSYTSKHQTLHDAEAQKKTSIYLINKRNGNLKKVAKKSNV